MFMPHWPIPKWSNDIKYDLSRIKDLLFHLDNPQLKLPPTIHVAGTNGKGSTVAFLKSIFEKSNYKAHVYTSPHILRFNERIVVANSIISDEYLFYLCEKIRLVSEKNNIEPSFFEATTAAAFLAFSENDADVLLLETGMGGRLDATNAIENPLACIITPISYDHTQYLGETLGLIAGEKAEIIKNKSLVFISKQEKDAADIIFDKCSSTKVLSRAYEYDFGILKNDQKDNDNFIVKSNEYEINLEKPSLLGDHQLINASVVVDLTKIVLQKIYKNITDESINLGIKSASWMGRIQKVFSEKIKNSANIIADGAHNDGGAEVLSKWIRDNLKKEETCIILGMTKNRNVIDFLSHFDDCISKVYCTSILSEPLSYSCEKIADILSEQFIPYEKLDSIDLAIERASSEYKNVIVTGSLFLVADLFKYLNVVQ
jgi:dihydrofolate synthase/folylpolyglutamate synthase